MKLEVAELLFHTKRIKVDKFYITKTLLKTHVVART